MSARPTDLLPPNATELERAFDREAQRAFEPASRIPVVWDPAQCPERLLPYLAWALSVDEWRDAWPLARKRQVIAASVSVHRRKGTIGAIRRALDALDLGVTISRWFEHGGEPFTLRAEVEVEDRSLTAEEIALITDTIIRTKAARSWLESLRVFLTARGSAFVAAAPASGVDMLVGPPPLEEEAVSYVACATRSVVTIEVFAA